MSYESVLAGFNATLTPELMPITAAVYGICFALKKSSIFPDRFIPLAAVGLGVLLNVLSGVFTRAGVISGVVNGVVCGMGSVYIHNLIKQKGE